MPELIKLAKMELKIVRRCSEVDHRRVFKRLSEALPVLSLAISRRQMAMPAAFTPK